MGIQNLYAKVVSTVLEEGRHWNTSDLIEEIKHRLVALKIPIDVPAFHDAVARLFPRFPAAAPPVDQKQRNVVSLTHAEAVAAVARFKAAGLIKPIPTATPSTPEQTDRRRAAAIVAQAILEQVQRCEEAEQ